MSFVLFISVIIEENKVKMGQTHKYYLGFGFLVANFQQTFIKIINWLDALLKSSIHLIIYTHNNSRISFNNFDLNL